MTNQDAAASGTFDVAAVLSSLGPREFRSVVTRATGGDGTTGSAFDIALNAAILFGRRRYHDAARGALGVALAELRRSGERQDGDPRRFRLFACGAYLYYARGRLIRAETLTRYAIAFARRLSGEEREPAEMRARTNLAKVLTRMGRDGEATALLAEVFRDAPTATSALNVAFAHHDARRNTAVLATLDTPGIAYEPRESACAELLRVVSLHRGGDRAAAAAAFERYLKLSDRHGFQADFVDHSKDRVL
jgi:tetratricopeptide (TPR) repeat protein